MTTEEKAKAYAESVIDSFGTNGVPCGIKDIKHMITEGYFAGATEALASQWVSVEERLPEDATQCLVFLPGSYDDNIVRLAWYDGDKFHDVQTDQRYRPSFWMPIPIPPLKGGAKCQ